MSNDFKDPKFRKWLDQLQQESWQLELIISGFAIYGLIMAYEPLRISIKVAENEHRIYEVIISIIGLVACSILLFNLVLHVVLRGLWIGALGLRYVSGDIDFESLRYSEKFTRYLKNKIVSFDRYIAILENYCSVLFAVSFLLIFYVIAVVLSFVVVVGTAVLLIDNDSWGGAVRAFGIVFLLFILLGIALTLIDFLGQGILKKNKISAKIYFPFYWIFSKLTLSFLYRPLVYNFLDNRFGRRLSLVLIPAYALVLLIVSVDYRESNYLQKDQWSSSFYADSRNYEDLLTEEDRFVRIASIPSKAIKDPFLQVFVIHTESIEDRIYTFYPDLKPSEDKRGLQLSKTLSDDGQYYGQNRKLTEKFLRGFNDLYTIHIDSLERDSEFVISMNKKNNLGFETFVDISDLDPGKHLLKIGRKALEGKDTVTIQEISIPFWSFR
jgi:hypothetical protein